MAGAMKDTARPVVAYRPKISPSRPSGMRRARNERAADWAGPTQADSSMPSTQKIRAPPSCRKKTSMPATTRTTSAPIMTLRGPTTSSSRPSPMVATPATTLAAMAKTMTSPLEKPKVLRAIMPP